jgi:CheY-like chemotaxis protein
MDIVIVTLIIFTVEIMKYDFKNLTILIADDEKFNRFFLEELFKKTNATIISAKNGQEAVDCAKSYPEIRIALLDIRMPVMDGLQAAKIIRDKSDNIIIIALTAFVEELYEEPAFKERFDDYVFKPVHPEKLLRLIHLYSN